MADEEPTSETIALIFNTALPSPLGRISEELIEYINSWLHLPEYINVHPVDLAAFDLPKYDSSCHGHSDAQSEPSIAAWRSEISLHSALIFLFPLHTWSHTNPIKNAVEHLHTSVRQKPTVLSTFGEQDTRHWQLRQEKPGHVPRESTGMMEAFFRERRFNLVNIRKINDYSWPRFIFYDDIWNASDSDMRGIWPGGAQIEVWESSAWNPLAEAGKELVKMLEGRKKS